MGDVVALRTNSNYRSAVAPQRIMLSIEQMRAIDRDIRHLDAVMARMRDVTAIRTILSTTCGARRDRAYDRAARALGRFLSTGR